MSASGSATFNAALVQMRSSGDPANNRAEAVRLIEEAKERGADYVQTPEMTNILESKRDRFFASIVEEESDPTLATLRERARKLALYLHIGSLAIKVSPDKAANRAF